MHCALGRPFYGASKMAVTLRRKAPQSNQAGITVGFHFKHNKSSKARSLLSILVLHQPFYILIYIWTLPTLKTLDCTFYIGSTPTFLYFDLYLNTAYAAYYVYFIFRGTFEMIMVSLLFLEPCRLLPSVIKVNIRNQANMIQKVKVTSLLYIDGIMAKGHKISILFIPLFYSRSFIYLEK